MKFIVLSFKRNILPFTFVLFAIFLVIFSKSNLTATTNGLILWATCVVPSLFPFFVITNLLAHTQIVDVIGRFLDRFMRPIFNVPGIGGFAFVMGLISGYPVGAKIVSDFRERGKITQDEGDRMLAFTNNSGPLFILSSVGISLFGDTKTGLLLLITHILSCITVGIILGKFSQKADDNLINKSKIENINNNSTQNTTKNVSFKNLGEVLGNSINTSINTLLMIGGFVVIFSVIISMMNQIHAFDFLGKFVKPILKFIGFDLEFATPLLSGIIELTNGVKQVASVSIKAISQNVILCAFLLGFGGFSVFLQVFSIVSKTDLSMKKYFIGKFFQGIIASIYTVLALKFIPFINLDIVETVNLASNSISSISNSPIYIFFYHFGIFTICIILLYIMFNTFNKLYNSHKV